MPGRRRSMFAAVVSLAVIASPATAASSLTWRLENPFRLFRDAADFERLRMSAGSSIQDWFAGIAPQIQGEYLPYRRTYWDPIGGENTSGQYEAGYVRPDSHRIVLTWRDAPAGALCDWAIGNEQRKSISCSSITADIPYDYTQPQRAPTSVTVRTATGQAASTSVKVRDWLILGMGDSYSAGEGAPDRPAELTPRDAKRVRDPFSEESMADRWVQFPQLVAGKSVQWWDNECHRSLLSWQVLTALKLASDMAGKAAETGATEQHAITFASYACSGAKFYGGMFTPQGNPVGATKVQPAVNDTTPLPPGVQHSQLYAAARDLCENGSRLKARHRLIHLDLYKCPAPRKPDAVLLSVGGNDAGFAKAIMHKLVPLPGQGNSPPGQAALAVVHRLLGTVTTEDARDRTRKMAAYYRPLSETMQDTLGADPQTVIFMAYPNALMRPDLLRAPAPNGAYCGLEMRAGMEAARVRATLPMHYFWHFWPTQTELAVTVTGMINPLQNTIRRVVDSEKWRYVDSHLPLFEQHGMCADAYQAEDDSNEQPLQANTLNVERYGLPRYTKDTQGRMHSVGEATWRPYDPAQKRWLRTPNDSLRTQTDRTLARSISGSFHPTGAGYAAIADAAYTELAKLIRERQDAPAAGTH